MPAAPTTRQCPQRKAALRTFTITQATPTISLTDAGGTYSGKAFPATAKIAGVVGGVDTTPATSLEGVGLTVTYYVGSTVGSPGTGTTTAPSAVGTYTVVASFAGSTDYAAVLQSKSVTFTIGAGVVIKSAFKLGPSLAAINDAALLSLLG